MEDYYEYLDSNGVTTLYKLIKDDTVALIDSYSVTINGITTTLDTHINNSDIHTPISDIESMVDTKIAGLVNSAPETLDTLKELADALGNDTNFATTVANQIGTKADKDSVYTKQETDTLLEGKADSVHNHVVSDITDFPTIPTKTSQLINDSGFLTSSSGVITSVSWGDITDKPNFATVATSGSYTDLSNTPTIPTKVSQLENDTGFINALTDVVDTKSNQTINGVKTFTASPFVSNYAVTNGFFTKLNTIARNEIPSQIYHSAFRVFDKNSKTLGEYCVEKSTSGSSLLHMDVHTEDSEGNDIMESVYLNVSNDGSTVSFHPAKNNRIDLGMPSNKWANAYIGRVVCTRFTHSVNNGSVYITGGSEYDKGATLALHGEESSDAGSFIISSRDKTRTLYLVGKPDGTLQWAGQNIAIDENLVHRSGNETINGNKTFNNNVTVCGDLYDKNVQADLTQIPTSNIYTQYRFVDKNNKTMGYVQHVQKTTGISQLTFIVRDSNNVDHGFLVTTDKVLLPAGNNTYSLGSSGLKWANVYSTNNITNKVITYSVTNHNNTSSMTVSGGSSWDTGSTLFLYGNSHSKYPGAFNLAAKNTTNESKLIGFPNGTLTWNGKNLTTTEFVKGTNYWYRKHSDGFIEMGGIGNASIMESNNKVTLPIPFSNTNYVVTGSSNFQADVVFGVSSKTTTYFYCGLSQPRFTWATGTFSWYACGY